MAEELGQKFRTLTLVKKFENRSRIIKWREVRGSDGSLAFENAERKYSPATPFSIEPETDKKIRSIMQQIVESHSLKPIEAPAPKPAAEQKAPPAVTTLTSKVPSMEFLEIPVDRIRPNPDQPRMHITPDSVEEMKMSLQSEGQNTPIDVIRVKKDPKSRYPNAEFELVKGERRWTAARAIGKPTLYAIVHSSERIPDKVAQHRFCLVGDHHHQGYDPVELAFALKYQYEKGGLTLAQLAKEICGKRSGSTRSISWVAGAMAIANLHPELMKRLDGHLPRKEQITTSMARRLARWPKEKQVNTYEVVRKEKGSRLQLIKIQELATAQLPNKHPGRPRVPADNVKVMMVAIPRMTADAITVNAYPDETIASLVQNRPDDAVLALEQIAKTIDNLRSMEARIKKARKLPNLAKSA